MNDTPRQIPTAALWFVFFAIVVVGYLMWVAANG